MKKILDKAGIGPTTSRQGKYGGDIFNSKLICKELSKKIERGESSEGLFKTNWKVITCNKSYYVFDASDGGLESLKEILAPIKKEK